MSAKVELVPDSTDEPKQDDNASEIKTTKRTKSRDDIEKDDSEDSEPKESFFSWLTTKGVNDAVSYSQWGFTKGRQLVWRLSATVIIGCLPLLFGFLNEVTTVRQITKLRQAGAGPPPIPPPPPPPLPTTRPTVPSVRS